MHGKEEGYCRTRRRRIAPTTAASVSRVSGSTRQPSPGPSAHVNAAHTNSAAELLQQQGIRTCRCRNEANSKTHLPRLAVRPSVTCTWHSRLQLSIQYSIHSRNNSKLISLRLYFRTVTSLRLPHHWYSPITGTPPLLSPPVGSVVQFARVL